jgi:hypothetical protein
MRLNAKVLKNVNSVNSWVFANQAFMTQDQANTMYIQIVDLDQSADPAIEKSQAHPQFPIRYIPQGTVVGIEATFPSLEDSEQFTIIGTQPFAQDRSIWKFDLSAVQVPSSGNVDFKLTEDGSSKSFKVKNAVQLDPTSIGGC